MKQEQENLEQKIDDPDETKTMPAINPEYPTCLAKKYEVRMLEKGIEMPPHACTEHCDGKDTECIYWIAQYGPNGKGWNQEPEPENK